MADESELEKRAVEELLRETNRARVRAETMGPAGWMKCPLRSTNKRFLLNTLRSTGLQRHTNGPAAEKSTTRGRPRSESRSQDRSRSRTPPRNYRANAGHRDHKPHHRSSSNHNDKKYDRNRDKSYCHKDMDNRDQRRRKNGLGRDTETDKFHCKDHSPAEGHSSSGGLSRECCRSHHSGSPSFSCSPCTGHAPQSGFQHNRTCSPVSSAHSGRSQK
ncbi:uncharacterized protein ACJ7VT_016894 [Polymixia lowei]